MSHLMIVDDEPSILSVISTFFKAEGYEVTPVLGGDKAIDLLCSTQVFDLVLSDIRMSPADGWDVLHCGAEYCQSTIFIMLSAYGDEPGVYEIFNKHKNVFDFIYKQTT